MYGNASLGNSLQRCIASLECNPLLAAEVSEIFGVLVRVELALVDVGSHPTYMQGFLQVEIRHIDSPQLDFIPLSSLPFRVSELVMRHCSER